MNMDMNSILGLLASALISILLFQMCGQRSDSKVIGEKLDAHILEVTKALALKVDSAACKNIRNECIALNHKIIRAPLESEIKQIQAKRRECWTQQADDNKAMWRAIRGHTHTEIPDRDKDKVIIPKNGG
jgi:hypothetical protein